MDDQNNNAAPTRLSQEQLNTAVQIAIAAIQATQPATITNAEGLHRRVTGLKDAPRFNGKMDVRMWIRRYEAYAHAMGWNDAEQLDTLTVALEEAANEWLWSQERRDPDEETAKDKLARRKAGLVKRFGQTLISHADYTQLYAAEARQQGNGGRAHGAHGCYRKTAPRIRSRGHQEIRLYQRIEATVAP